MMAKVSVIVPVYNGANFIEKTVKSILEQTFASFELLLIDDGSKDNSFDIIKSLSSKDSRIKCLQKENGGVAHARNHGIKLAQGEFIAFCDQDDLWLPEKLSKQVALFESQEVGVVYCGSIVRNEMTNVETKTILSERNKGWVFEKLLEKNFVGCCTAIVKKCYLDEVGGFDSAKELMGVDDWHVFLKLSLVAKFDYVNDHLAVHIFHGDNYSLNDVKMHDAEMVCLDKIKKIYKGNYNNIDWAEIEQNVNTRYAKSYLFSGMFNLASRTYYAAHKCKFNIKLLIKSVILRIIPNKLLIIGKRLKSQVKPTK